MKPFLSYRFFEKRSQYNEWRHILKNLETKYQNHSGIKGRNGGKVVM